jgi:hypothetical protein
VLKSNGLLQAYYNRGVNPDGTVSWGQTSTGGYQIGEGWGMPDSAVYFADLRGN